MSGIADMTSVIVPKSDQLNSDDLIAGPRTIKIRDVKVSGGTEQPVSIYFEGDENKPYKPCKSMSRVLVTCWGADAKQYVGRSLTLYRDPSVKWAGMEVGGIRISHMSDISSDMTMALTASKAKRAPFTVKVLKGVAPATTPEDDRKAADVAEIIELGKKLNAANDSIKWSGKTTAEFANEMFGTEIRGLGDLSAEQLTTLLTELNERLTSLDERGSIASD